MKYFLAICLILSTAEAFSQTGWAYLGKEIGYEFYYEPSSVRRGNNPFVIVLGVPIQEMKDKDQVVIKYVSVNIKFYQSSQDLRCLIFNHMFFYSDKSFKKAGLPKRDLPITYYKLLMTLYDLIK
jgi:hypothetical protein